MRNLWQLALLAAIGCFVWHNPADAVVVSPSVDYSGRQVNNTTSGSSGGSSLDYRLDNAARTDNRLGMEFPLAGLPTNQVLIDATLRMRPTAKTGNSILELHGFDSNGLFSNSDSYGDRNLIGVMTDHTVGIDEFLELDPGYIASLLGTAINASPSSAQTLSATPAGGLITLGPDSYRLNFGNIRVGDAKTLGYHITNGSGVGQSLRGAIQTTVGGGNLNDARLSGAGVTPSNFGPLAPMQDTVELAVTFNGAMAGPLTGQQVRIINNFDNVNDPILQFTGAAYNPAVDSITPAAISFGNFHVGDPIPSAPITISNIAPPGAFSEDLLANHFQALNHALIVAGSQDSVQVVAGGSNNALRVTIDNSVAGARSGLLTMDVHSSAEVAGVPVFGLTPLTLGPRFINLSANIYRFAAPVVNDLNLGEFHVGEAAQGNINVQNAAVADAFSETLRAMVTGFNPAVTAASGTADIPPGANSGNALSATLSTANAGMITGTVDVGLTSLGGAAGLTNTPLATQQASVRASVFRLAEPVIQNAQPINFGIVHVGDTIAQAGLGILNNAAADGFSEKLNASFGPVEVGVITNGGAISGLAPQASDATSMTVGIDTSAAQIINRMAIVEFQSDGTGINTLGQTELPIQTVQVTGQVNNFAEALLSKLAGSGTFVQNNPMNYTLDFGTLAFGAPSAMAELGVTNDVLAPADNLNGTWTFAAMDFDVSGFNPFNDLAAGNTLGGLLVELDTDMLGSFAGTVVLHPVGTNASGFSGAQPNITIQLFGNVIIPEPISLALLLPGVIFLAALRVRWHN